MRRLIQIVLCVVVSSCALFAQDEVPTKITNQNRTGDLPYSSSIGTAVEHVDLATGALSIHIPLWSVPGRGMSSELSYHWNSNYLVAAPRTDSLGNPYYTYAIAKNSGWQTNHTLMTNALLSVQCNGLTRRWGSNYMYQDEEGGKHQMAMQTGGSSNMCLSPSTLNNPDLSSAGIMGDGTGHGVILADGTAVNAGVGTYKDANGNTRSMTLPPMGQPPTSTDTLGRAFFTAVEGPLDPVGRPTQTTYTVKDANGIAQNITIVWAALNITTSFATPGVRELGGKEWWAIQSITLPNGTAYHFQYEPDYGELKEIDLPTGGVITYTWANYTYPNPANTIPASESRRYVSSRTETVNGVSNTWNFQLTSLAVGKDQSVVTYPPVPSLSGGTVQTSPFSSAPMATLSMHGFIREQPLECRCGNIPWCTSMMPIDGSLVWRLLLDSMASCGTFDRHHYNTGQRLDIQERV